ncbi:MAG: MBL fold metallo-hydrolase [Pseudomonadota bacterium]
MIFKQMFDTESSTLTYLLMDEVSHEGALIDPVAGHTDDYIAVMDSLGCKLKFSLETHVHADHITASGKLREMLAIQTGVSELCGASTADIQLNDNDVLMLGSQEIKVIATPGHTIGSVSFLCNERLFTGDTLLINGCGRTDFQGGSAAKLFDSITKRILTLPDETLIYPGHDYNGRRVSSVAQEKITNLRIVGKTKEEFIELMNNLNLAKPKLIDVAVPANRMCGILEENLPQG